MPEVFSIVAPQSLGSGPARPSGKQVLNGTADYLIADYVREIAVQRVRTLAETYRAFTTLLDGIQTVLSRYPVARSAVAFDTVTWTRDGHLVIWLTYSADLPSSGVVPRIHDFVDDVVRPVLGVQNAPCKSLVTGLCDQLAVAAKHAHVDLHRVRFVSLRSTRHAQLVADIVHGRRMFRPVEAAW